jgi:beta-1,4-mannosyl-glycoprotein beta-1,4-N-acetylglucosaminyltransferase
MATHDVMLYNGERDVLKIHLSILSPYVDKFIICESNQTFTGHQKPLYFFRDQRYFKKFWPQIEYYVINDWEDETIWDMARKSPNTKGAEHWKREFYIKESIHKSLKGIQDTDTVFIGDVDEIINPEAVYESLTPTKAKLDVYAYYLNNRSSEQFWGTLIAEYKDIKGQCLNHLRTNTDFRSETLLGWHFTSQGGIKEVQRKLNDSYTTESYNTPEVQQLLAQRHQKGVDYLGRDFTFTRDESNWPQYLKENKGKYSHLCLEN